MSLSSLSSLSPDLEAVESRVLSEAPEYKNLMQAGGAGGARLGQTRLAADTSNLNNLWLQYGQNLYNRKGASSASEQAATSSQLGAAYPDYADYADYND